MLIRLGYDIELSLPLQTPIVAMLNVHPSRVRDLLEPDLLQIEPAVPIETFTDLFGNTCCRFVAGPGNVRLLNSTLIQDPGQLDPVNLNAREVPVGELPLDTLRYLMASRYCEVDLLSDIAANLFGHLPRGWSRVKAVCEFVYGHVTFGYAFARNTKSAMDVYNERQGVCRDFQHLAITLCRCLNIPARYATGYLGDIGVPLSDTPMDFSAWFEVYLEDRWWTFDARHNAQRIGRVLMGTGLDATDVALTTTFGSAPLVKFTVVTDEVPASQAVVIDDPIRSSEYSIVS